MEEKTKFPTNKDELSENKNEKAIRMDTKVSAALASEEACQNNSEDEKKISEILCQLCFKPKLSGYRYLVFSILLYKCDPYYRADITKRLYPAVGEKYHKSARAVDSAIRRAIGSGIGRCDSETFKLCFGYTYDKDNDKITHGELIALIAEKIRLC